MIEEVEELETDTQHALFPARNPSVLHDGEVGIEVAWPAEVIASLGEVYSGAVAGS